MHLEAVATSLAERFQANPVEYVAEADLQFALVDRLRTHLTPQQATVRTSELRNTSDGFKRDYWQVIERQLASQGGIDRVHTEVSVRQGERLDVAVFDTEIHEPIKWVAGGSKRFAATDLTGAIEVKFVKNKRSFPRQAGNRIEDLVADSPSDERLLGDDGQTPILDFQENSLSADLDELNRLSGVDQRALLLFSNNNYCYHDPTDAELAHQYGEFYHRIGRLARDWLGRHADDGVAVLYAHPRGMDWLSRAE